VDNISSPVVIKPVVLDAAKDPLVDQVLRGSPEELIDTMITGLVGLYADNGRWLRAIDAAAADPDVAAALGALWRRLLAQ
jgi:hypothetical protein